MWAWNICVSFTDKKKKGHNKLGVGKQKSPCKTSEGQGAGQAMPWCLVRGCIRLRAWWHLVWEMMQHLMFPSRTTLIKEKLIPNLACLSHGAHWRTFADRRKLTIGSVVSYPPKSHGMSVLQNTGAPDARSASESAPSAAAIAVQQETFNPHSSFIEGSKCSACWQFKGLAVQHRNS